MRLPLACSLLLLCASRPVPAAEPDDPVILQNEGIRIVLTKEDGRWGERFEARSGETWVPLLRSGHRLRAEPAWRRDGVNPPVGYATMQRLPGNSGEEGVVLTAQEGPAVIRKHITLGRGDAFARVVVTADVRGPVDVGHLLATYTAFPADVPDGNNVRPDFVFTPQLRPRPSDVIGDHTFRSPALMLQRGPRFVALVPDVTLMDTPQRRVQTAADVRLDGGTRPLLSYGLMPWVRRAHVYYEHTDTTAIAVRDTTLAFGYFVFCTAAAPEREGYRDVVRFLWDRIGRGWFSAAGGPQHDPYAVYIRKAWDEFVPAVALETEYGGRRVTLLRQARLAWSNKLPKAADDDCWFNVWFNALRTAYGMAFEADRAGRADLARLAEGVLTLALLAPQSEGIAPSIFYVDSLGGHWVGDHAWGGIGQGEYLPMFHNAWTGVWLLQWADLRPERRQEILAHTGRLARFLIARQQRSGVIPSWYAPGTLEPAAVMRDENAETAGAALFLAEYARMTGDREALVAAQRGMEYIRREILPEHRWFDYETFFSCSRKPPGFFDGYTGQHPQNTLSMHQAAEAWLVLHELTGDTNSLHLGEAVLDYLGLYQQVWSPRWLSCDLFGGFGVQNTDGEWSDSRQGYFAVTYMRYFAATGKREYFERGVAALRAMFSLFESPASPRTAENYAHGAEDRLAGVTGLHWGTGSSVVSVHLITHRYGDAYIHARDGWGGGIDGCRVTDVRVTKNEVRCIITDDVRSPRRIRLVVGAVDPGTYTVVVNGTVAGRFSSAMLGEGIYVEI